LNRLKIDIACSYSFIGKSTMSHVCKCGNIFFNISALNKHQQTWDCMLEKHSVVDLYNISKAAKEKLIADFVKLCHKEILEAINKGQFRVSVPYTELIVPSVANLRIKNIFSGINASLDEDKKKIDFAWDIEDVLKTKEPRIFDMEMGSIKLYELILKLDSKIYSPVVVWNHEKACNFIDSIMRGLPIPCIYFIQHDITGLHCLDGYNRINTLLDYINPKSPDDKKPIAWIKKVPLPKDEIWAHYIKEQKGEKFEYVYYEETCAMDEYVSAMKDKDKNNTYRFMTDEEQNKFKNYMVCLCIINGDLNTDEEDFIKEQINDESIIDFSKFTRTRSYKDDDEDIGKCSLGLKFLSGVSMKNPDNFGKKRMGKSEFLNYIVSNTK
jgi:hypothetical protein